MGLLDIFSSLFSSKKTNLPTTPVEATPQVQNTTQVVAPVTDTTATAPQSPIEEPASVKSIDDLLKENENKIETPVNTGPVQNTVPSAPQAGVNPAEPTPGIGTTHTTNSLHSNETNTITEENNGVKNVSL